MLNTRIYKILSKLSKPKLNRFQKFIDSPYFNKNLAISKLCSYLISNLKSGDELKTKQVIWNEVQEKIQTYNDLKFRKLCNDLLDKYERFLINESLSKDNLLQANLLLNSIENNNEIELIEKHISKSNRLIKREIDQSANYYLQQYYYDKNLYNLKSTYERKQKIKKSSNPFNLVELSKNLDTFYVIERLRHATDFLTWRKLYKSDKEIDINSTIDIIHKNNLTEIPAVKIYYLMYKLMADLGTEDTYFELKKIGQERIEYFPREEQKEVLDVLLSFCIKDVNKGKKEAYSEVLELYDWGIDIEIIFDKGFLSPTTFRNYVVIGLRDGRFEQVENFIKNKAEFLHASTRENALYFNLGRLAYYRQDYSEVLLNLNKVNYDDIWYNINSRSILLLTYYALDEIETLEYQLENFVVFLRRNKSLETNKRALYNNFLTYLKKLIKSYKKSDLEKLKVNLEDERVVNNKAWLLKKIDEKLSK